MAAASNWSSTGVPGTQQKLFLLLLMLLCTRHAHVHSTHLTAPQGRPLQSAAAADSPSHDPHPRHSRAPLGGAALRLPLQAPPQMPCAGRPGCPAHQQGTAHHSRLALRCRSPPAEQARQSRMGPGQSSMQPNTARQLAARLPVGPSSPRPWCTTVPLLFAPTAHPVCGTPAGRWRSKGSGITVSSRPGCQRAGWHLQPNKQTL